MTRLEYLRWALILRLHRRLDWLISAFSVISEAPDAWKSDPYPGRIVQLDYGTFFVNEQQELQKITDLQPKMPPYGMLDELTIDASWIPNCDKPTPTLVGALIANWVLLVESFGSKVPYVADNMDLREIEAYIIEHRRTKENPDENRITVEEYLKMAEGVELLKQTTSLSVYSLTPRNMTPPEGYAEFKKQLVAEYGDRLKDPVILAEFEEKLMAFDREKMKGDPSYGKLVSGKVHRNARRKLVLTSGAEGGLNGQMVPIHQSLADGVPLTPENFAAQVNGSRSGSYFRGVDTVKGGVSSKKTIRAFSAYSIVSGDCQSPFGIKKQYTKFNIANLVGRMIVGSKTRIEKSSDAANYLGQVIRVRSPQYCRLKNDFKFCEACAGPRLARFKDGLVIPGTDLTAAIMAASMAAMHKNTTTTAEVELENLLT